MKNHPRLLMRRRRREMKAVAVTGFMLVQLLLSAAVADARTFLPSRLSKKTTSQQRTTCLYQIRGGSAAAADSEWTPLNAQTILSTFSEASNFVWNKWINPAIQDPETHITKPLQEFFLEDPSATQERRKLVTNGTAVTLSSAIFLRPTRMARLVIVAVILAEGMGAVGLVHNGQANEVKEKIQQAWNSKAKPALEKVKRETTMWWDSVSERHDWKRLHTWAPKYQWALGTAVGLIVSPAAVSLSWSALRIGALAFAVAELNKYAKRQSDAYESKLAALQKDNDLLASLDTTLEAWRQRVRSSLNNPHQVVTALQDVIKKEAEEGNKLYQQVPADARRGLIVGTLLGLVSGA